MRIGGIEAGGTKFVLLVAEVKENRITEVKRERIPTVTPEVTMEGVRAFFEGTGIEALGVGSFGPVCLDTSDSRYGHILHTPKIAWRDYDIYGYLKKNVCDAVYLNTDVGLAAYGEYKSEANKGVENLLYLTVGTGVGGGIINGGKIYQGRNHAELGHVVVDLLPEDVGKCNCPSHKNCIEGMVSGPAINKYYADIPYEKVGYYLSQAILGFVYSYCPDRVIIGGGIGNRKEIAEEVRRQFPVMNNGYVTYDALEHPETFFVNPTLGDNSGIYGAILYAYDNCQ